MFELSMEGVDRDDNKEISEDEISTTLEKIKNNKAQYKEFVDNLTKAINSGEYNFGVNVKEAYEQGDEEINKLVEESGLESTLGIKKYPYLTVGQTTETKKISKPNLRNVEHNINIEFNRIIEWAKSNYNQEYESIIENKEKEYIEREKGEIKDYIRYDLITRSIIKYSQELEKEQNDMLKKHGFYEEIEFVDKNGIENKGENYGGWEYFIAEEFFKFINESQYEGYTADQELLNNYSSSIQTLLESTGYDKPGKFKEDTKAYKSYNKELEKEGERLNYQESITYLKENAEPEDEGQVTEYITHLNSVMEYSNSYENIQQKYGPKRIEGYETVIGEINKIEKKNPGLTAAMDRISEYNIKLETKKEGLGIDEDIISRYVNYMNDINTSGMITRYKRLGILDTQLNNEINGNSGHAHIFPNIKKQLAEQKLKQEKTDEIRRMIEEAPVPGLYTVSNFVVGAWNGVSDGLIGTGTGLGVLLESLWKDEHELKAEFERAEKRNNFLKIGQSTRQKEPPVKDGKFNLDFDNTVGQLGGQTMNMLILLSGAGAIGRGVAKGGVKLGLQMTEAVANKAGLVTYAMAQGLGSSFGEGMAAGLSKSEARNYALVQSVISSSLELVAPNAMFFGTANIGKVLKQLTNKEVRGLVIKNYLKNIGKEMGEEIVQENVQLVVSKGINAMTNEIYNTTMESDVSLADITTTAILTGLTTGMVSSRGSYKMAKVKSSNNYAKQWIVSDEVRYNDYKNKLNNVVEGKTNIMSVEQAQNLLVELDIINNLIKGQKLNQDTKTKTESKVSEKNQYNVSAEVRKEWSETFGTDGESLKSPNGKYDLENQIVEEGMNKVQGLLDSKGFSDKLTEKQQQAILEAHFDIKTGDNVAKGRSLRNSGLSEGQVRVLMEYQVCGIWTDILNFVGLGKEINQKKLFEDEVIDFLRQDEMLKQMLDGDYFKNDIRRTHEQKILFTKNHLKTLLFSLNSFFKNNTRISDPETFHNYDVYEETVDNLSKNINAILDKIDTVYDSYLVDGDYEKHITSYSNDFGQELNKELTGFTGMEDITNVINDATSFNEILNIIHTIFTNKLPEFLPEVFKKEIGDKKNILAIGVDNKEYINLLNTISKIDSNKIYAFGNGNSLHIQIRGRGHATDIRIVLNSEGQYEVKYNIPKASDQRLVEGLRGFSKYNIVSGGSDTASGNFNIDSNENLSEVIHNLIINIPTDIVLITDYYSSLLNQEGEISIKNQYNVSIEERKIWSKTFGIDRIILQKPDRTYDLENKIVKKGMEKVQGLLDSKGFTKELTPDQQQAILTAHFEVENNLAKGRSLRNSGLSEGQVRVLLEYQVCGLFIDSRLTGDERVKFNKIDFSELNSVDYFLDNIYEGLYIDIKGVSNFSAGDLYFTLKSIKELYPNHSRIEEINTWISKIYQKKAKVLRTQKIYNIEDYLTPSFEVRQKWESIKQYGTKESQIKKLDEKITQEFSDLELTGYTKQDGLNILKILDNNSDQVDRIYDRSTGEGDQKKIGNTNRYILINNLSHGFVNFENTNEYYIDIILREKGKNNPIILSKINQFIDDARINSLDLSKKENVYIAIKHYFSNDIAYKKKDIESKYIELTKNLDISDKIRLFSQTNPTRYSIINSRSYNKYGNDDISEFESKAIEAYTGKSSYLNEFLYGGFEDGETAISYLIFRDVIVSGLNKFPEYDGDILWRYRRLPSNIIKKIDEDGFVDNGGFASCTKYEDKLPDIWVLSAGADFQKSVLFVIKNPVGGVDISNTFGAGFSQGEVLLKPGSKRNIVGKKSKEGGTLGDDSHYDIIYEVELLKKMN